MRQEVTEMNGDAGQRFQRPQVELLSYRLVRIIRSGRHQGGEILDLVNRVFWQQEPAERFEIEPAVRSSAQCAVVQIEAVDIDVRYQSLRSKMGFRKMQKPPF